MCSNCHKLGFKCRPSAEKRCQQCIERGSKTCESFQSPKGVSKSIPFPDSPPYHLWSGLESKGDWVGGVPSRRFEFLPPGLNKAIPGPWSLTPNPPCRTSPGASD
jgi:hypothetical protein